MNSPMLFLMQMDTIDGNQYPASTSPWTRNPGWWAIIVSAGAFLFSGIALYLSYSDPSRLVAEAILEQSPNVILNWRFNTVEIGGGTTIPPHLSIQNVGPIAASQLRIWIFEWRVYLNSEAKIRSINSDCVWVFSRLDPFKDTIVGVSKMCLWPLSIPPAISVFEIRMHYRREVDLKPYLKRAFAIKSNDGIWKNAYSIPDDSLKQPLLNIINKLPVEEPMNWDDAVPVEVDN